jgi:hypothetical protein
MGNKTFTILADNATLRQLFFLNNLQSQYNDKWNMFEGLGVVFVESGDKYHNINPVSNTV